ncbi:MAG: glycosyltransferase family 2 protein [Neisseriaceae bacterium]|nr:glycosyltransferase family 2 protein [Neisseriaceae bacterium]
MIDVSVVIPVYNASLWLEECVNSVLSQQGVRMEVLLLDDCSTDESLSLAKQFQKQDDRVIVIQHPERVYSAVLRNQGIDLARGEYIAFMDADDFYPSEDTLHKLIETARKEDAPVCGGSLQRWDQQRKAVVSYVPNQYFLNEQWADFVDYQYVGGFYRYVYRKSFLDQHQLRFANLRRFQDCEWLARVMATNPKFYTIKDCVYIYRKGHKKVAWNHENLKDHLTGVLSVLNLSKQHEYSILHFRMAKNFLDALAFKLRYRYIEKFRLLPLMIRVYKAIDFKMMGNAHRTLHLNPIVPAKILRAFLLR